MPTAQNNQYSKVGDLGVACSATFNGLFRETETLRPQLPAASCISFQIRDVHIPIEEYQMDVSFSL